MKTIEVVAAIIRKGDRIFATQRGYGPWKDYWEYPGGKVEAGETPVQALVREIREELDAEISIDKYLTTIEWDYPQFHLTMHCYICSLLGGALQLNEHEASSWLGKDDLHSVNWLPADNQLIPLIEKELDSTTVNVLFVCHGNICRSPMAEFILKALVKAKGLEDQYYIESAAVSAEEIGNPIYPPAKRCLNQHGVWFDPNKRARQVRASDYRRFDRIICMDASNLRLIKRFIPDDPEGKIHLMMSYTGVGRDVADPWYTGDFEETFQDLLEACEAMLRG